MPPKGRFQLVAELVNEAVPAKRACHELAVSRSGFYEWRRRAPSPRAIRHAWLSDIIGAVHEASRATYGGRRIHAELVHAQGIRVGYNTVSLLMRRAGLSGLPLRRRARRVPPAVTVTDLVQRDFRRDGPNQLWVTDITEHPTGEGKLYCCVVIDTYSRRVGGWSIDSRARADLATNALGMAIDSRGDSGGQVTGGVIHGDHGTQVNSTGRRNTSIVEVLMGRPAGWMTALTGRSPLKSPGAPSHRREIEREFWREIAKGLTSEQAAIAVGASQAIGSRWFRQRGGMPSIDLAPLCGQYLSFQEREEIAILTAQGAGIRQIARRLGRDPSTISRELRRNAATRGGKLDYRASVAQWKAELLAQPQDGEAHRE